MSIHEYNNGCAIETKSLSEEWKNPREEWEIKKELKTQNKMLEELTEKINLLWDRAEPILMGKRVQEEWDASIKTCVNEIHRDIIQRNDRLERSIKSLQSLIDRINI